MAKRNTQEGPHPEGEELLRRNLRQRRNIFPEGGIRVPASAMHDLVEAVLLKAGASQDDATLLADILVANDLRCLFSHGTRQVADYARNMLSGRVNPRPDVKIVSESPGALVMDGDGGLGYFPCHRGTALAIAKARTCGVAALTTGNHHHFGAASNYSRQALAHDCIGISISASRSSRRPEDPIHRIITGSPMSIAIPAGEQPPLVLDMGGLGVGFSPEAFERSPAPIFKALGLTAVIHSLGGVLPGIYREAVREGQWESNQGAFIAVFAVEHFMPLDEARREMDTFIAEARAMQPFPGVDRAELAGGFEWEWEQQNQKAGIPVRAAHQAELEEIAREVGVETPFERFADTRFGSE